MNVFIPEFVFVLLFMAAIVAMFAVVVLLEWLCQIILNAVYCWYSGKPRVCPVTFNEREQKVLRQLMDFIKVPENNGDDRTVIYTLRDILLNINGKPYVQHFIPAPGQIRLERAEWDAFVAKLHAICKV